MNRCVRSLLYITLLYPATFSTSWGFAWDNAFRTDAYFDSCEWSKGEPEGPGSGRSYWYSTSMCNSNQCANVNYALTSFSPIGCKYQRGSASSERLPYFAYYPLNIPYSNEKCTIEVKLILWGTGASSFSSRLSGASASGNNIHKRLSTNCADDLMGLGTTWGEAEFYNGKIGRDHLTVMSPSYQREVYVDGTLVGSSVGVSPTPPTNALCSLTSPSSILFDHGTIGLNDTSTISETWSLACNKPGSATLSFVSGGSRVATGYSVDVELGSPSIILCLTKPSSPSTCYGNSANPVLNLSGTDSPWGLSSNVDTHGTGVRKGDYSGNVILMATYN